jgi:hypothetical protein
MQHKKSTGIEWEAVGEATVVKSKQYQFYA